jgi:ribonuclease-3
MQSPAYEVISESGPDHLKEFVCRVLWEGRELGRGSGQSKKQAEINAATDALLRKLWET